MRLLPPTTIPQHVLAISVDVPAMGNKKGRDAVGQGVKGDDIVGRLIKVFDRYGIPVTWGLGEMNAPVRVEQFQASELGHEVALLGASEWLGDGSRRGPMRRELARQFADASRFGMEPSTLVVRGGVPQENFDVMMQHGIRLVASDREVTEPGDERQMIRTLRYGFWELPAASRMSGGTAMRGNLSRTLRGRTPMDRVIDGGGLFHLAVDGPETSRSSTSRRGLERTLAHVARRRDRGGLQVWTMAEISRAISCPPATTPARSILRAA